MFEAMYGQPGVRRHGAKTQADRESLATRQDPPVQPPSCAPGSRAAQLGASVDRCERGLPRVAFLQPAEGWLI